MTAIYNEEYDWDDQHRMLFQWLENYSCDCNRRTSMYNDRETDFECGEEVQLLSITDENGNVVYTKGE